MAGIICKSATLRSLMLFGLYIVSRNRTKAELRWAPRYTYVKNYVGELASCYQ